MLNFGSLMLQKLLGKKSLAPEKRAERNTHDDKSVEISSEQLKRLMADRWRPDIYDVMRALSSGRYKRMGNKNGFPYHANLNTPKMKAKRLRQIEKGMIQVTPESKQPTQEVSNAG